jgi:Flp pilus assembly protein TadG
VTRQPRTERPRRRAQRGQAIPIIAVASTVLLGFTAMAVDLSLQTHTRRDLQNATDGAALAGAHHLSSAPVTQSQRIAGVQDAVEVLHNRLQWPLGGSTVFQYAQSLTSSSSGCSGSASCSVTFTAGGDTVTVSTPPVTARGAVYDGDSQYLEVNVRQRSAAGIGGGVGMIAGDTAAHAIAYHFAPGQPFGFALYADSFALDSNYDQVITGNIYAYRSIQPQSNGHSATCAQGGSVVLGDPQAPHPTPSPDTAAGQPQQASTLAASLTFLADCSSAGGGEVAQTATEGCPGSIPGVSLTAANSYVDDPSLIQTLPSGIGTVGTTRACVAYPAIAPPDLGAPTLDPNPSTFGCNGNGGLIGGVYQPGIYTCGLTVDHPLAPGVYEIVHNTSLSNDVTVSQAVSGTCNAADAANYDVCLYGVTFYLQQNGGAGAAMYVGKGGGLKARITPYSPTGSSNPNDGRFPVYAPRGVTAQLNVDQNHSMLSLQGTVYMPSGTTSMTSNADLAIDGQAIVASWVNQGGNHPNPRITYDGGVVAQQREVLRLVE